MNVNAVAWNRTGTKIVTGGLYGSVDLWQASGSDYTAVSLPSPIHLDGPARNVAMSPDGSRFALVTSTLYTVQIRNADTGQLLQTLKAVNPIETVAFNPNGHQIVAADRYGQVEVWNSAATNPRMLGTPSPFISDIRFNQSGSEFVTAAATGIVNVWNARDDRPLKIDRCVLAAQQGIVQP